MTVTVLCGGAGSADLSGYRKSTTGAVAVMSQHRWPITTDDRVSKISYSVRKLNVYQWKIHGSARIK